MTLCPFFFLAHLLLAPPPSKLTLVPARSNYVTASQVILASTQHSIIIRREFGTKTPLKPQGTTISRHYSNLKMIQQENDGRMNAIIYDLEKPKMIRKPIPILKGRHHILVKIHAAGVNPVDAKKVFGDKLPIHYSPFKHFVNYAVKSCCPGLDFSGVVHEIPSNMEGEEECPYRVGDKVYGTAPPFMGTFCEYQLVPLDQVQHMPSTLSFVEAAALPLTGLTCLQSLAMALPLGNKDNNDGHHHLLVIGASGGTGHFAIQYAKRHLHIKRVVGVCGTTNLKWVKETLGADNVIDYQDDQWQDYIKQEVDEHGPFTCVLDTVFSSHSHDKRMGYERFLRSSSSCKYNKLLEGMYVRLGGDFTSWVAAGLKRTIGVNLFHKDSELFWVRFSRSSGELDILRKVVDEENVKPYVLQTLPFTEENVAQAFDSLKSRRVRGKIVLSIVPSE
jgi:NADPH:quinone reductase-like Zn-dependent oxidoreductase